MMAIDDRKGNELLFSLLEEGEHISAKLQVLLFYRRHPRAKFTLECIARALDVPRLYLRETVRALVEKGIIEKQHTGSGITWYFLSQEQQKRQCVEELAHLDWGELRYCTGRVGCLHLAGQ